MKGRAKHNTMEVASYKSNREIEQASVYGALEALGVTIESSDRLVIVGLRKLARKTSPQKMFNFTAAVVGSSYHGKKRLLWEHETKRHLIPHSRPSIQDQQAETAADVGVQGELWELRTIVGVLKVLLDETTFENLVAEQTDPRLTKTIESQLEIFRRLNRIEKNNHIRSLKERYHHLKYEKGLGFVEITE